MELAKLILIARRLDRQLTKAWRWPLLKVGSQVAVWGLRHNVLVQTHPKLSSSKPRTLVPYGRTQGELLVTFT
jgi:hypothetical protein